MLNFLTAQVENIRTVYDPETGWTSNPNFHWNPLYGYNSDGLRSNVEFSDQPIDGILRIAIFGDSFTHGSDVRLVQSWGYQLQYLLNERGIAAEVLNFGVGGYGMDQAYLRWKADGRSFSPHIVIFGFHPENMFRNTNIVRGIYRNITKAPTPFTKPRFVLDNNKLQLINQPAVSPEAIIPMFKTFTDHPLVQYEDYYLPPIHSRLLEIIGSPTPPRLENLVATGKYVQLGEAIIDAFAAEVKANNASFIILHLPGHTTIKLISEGRPLPYDPLLERLSNKYDLVQPETSFSNLENIFLEFKKQRGHYTPAANLLIAENLVDKIANCVEEFTCVEKDFHTTSSTEGAYPGSLSWQKTIHLHESPLDSSADLVIDNDIDSNSPFLPLVGDWDGDGVDSVGLFNGHLSVFHLGITDRASEASAVFQYGFPASGYQPITGDWDGDGIDTIGLYNPTSGYFYLRNTNSEGNPEEVLRLKFKNSGTNIAVAGDWNGDNIDTIATYNQKNRTFSFHDEEMANQSFQYGPGGHLWFPISGDWDGDEVDSVGIYNVDYGYFYLLPDLNMVAKEVPVVFNFNTSSHQIRAAAGSRSKHTPDGLVIYVK